MINCFFVSDLHGQEQRYHLLFKIILNEKPTAVFIGGDLFPHASQESNFNLDSNQSFISGFLQPGFQGLHEELGRFYPRIFLILGNDDHRIAESDLALGEKAGLWAYIPQKCVSLDKYLVFGYPYVPPTPFILKDWEKYDVSRFIDPGCISPEEGWRTVPLSRQEIQFSTIQQDLKQLTDSYDLTNAIFLFHSPPYMTELDLLAVNGRTIEHTPLDTHAGSIAIKRFIESRQPLITLHGHLHESPRLSGSWKCQIGRTSCFSAAHYGSELAIVRFDPNSPKNASRDLIDL